MGVLDTAVDPRAQSYLDARTAMLASLAELEAGLDAAREGGGERAVTRHHARGKLLARERVELLVDRDSPLLELSPVAGWGTSAPVGAAVVTALGMVADRPCVIVASDPTVRDGAVGAGTLRKIQRAQQIAHQNRLPVIGLLEASGTEPAERSEVTGAAAELRAGLARLAGAGIPSTAVFFGDATELGGADLSDAFDYLVGLRPVTGHAVSSNGRPDRPAGAGGRPVDHLAEDERDALRLTRCCVQRFPTAAAAYPPTGAAAGAGDPAGLVGPVGPDRPVGAPRHDPEDLLAVPVTEPREILGRVLDDSALDEDQPGAGPAVCAGWGTLHGHRVAALAHAGPTAGAVAGHTASAAAGTEETDKTVRFVRRAVAAGTPLLVLRHGTTLGPAAEAGLAGAPIPTLVVRVGPWRGVCAVSAQARFRFAWPGASVTPTPTPPAGDGAGPGSSGPDSATESALRRSGRLADDGVIDPRDTRTVLGFCLSVIQHRRS
ncbi:MAG: acetyl-CoA carboxylase carboxyltransferase subunit [Micromonosporaceae bacterium]|nr:acetyl-CoA carboxylase carboxyltransferase subunit [Micromonosporaceae bacterium]